jgi:hypothetical protein
MVTITEELKLDFDFSNTFTSKDKHKEVPVFLRYRGIQGSLRASQLAESGGLDKVKLVLRGMKNCRATTFILLLTNIQQDI